MSRHEVQTLPPLSTETSYFCPKYIMIVFLLCKDIEIIDPLCKSDAFHDLYDTPS